MTDPASLVAGLRAGLDRLEQQAERAEKHWPINPHGIYVSYADTSMVRAWPAVESHIAAWPPDRVLGWCAAIRTIIDGYEAVVSRHGQSGWYDVPVFDEFDSAHAYGCPICKRPRPCPDLKAALAGLSSLAGVLTEGES